MAVECDWVFLDKGRSRSEATLTEPRVPNLGDGKVHGGKGYKVAVVVTDRVNTPNPTVVAVEH